ncbi:hypothetical protein P7C71_g4284, partial [Lecanoromycetidae sp. Uapishka_2]
MAAAVAFRQPLLPVASASRPPPAPSSQRSNDSVSSEMSRPSQTTTSKTIRGRKERPCDACRRKKSKSVVELQSQNNPQGVMKIKREESGGSNGSRSEAAVNSWQYQGAHMGYTTELDPILFDVSPSGEPIYQKSDGRNAFLLHQSSVPQYTESQSSLMQRIEKFVGSQSLQLVQHFRTINRSLPIIEDTFFETHNTTRRSTLDPALLCAVYVVAAASGAHELEKARWQNIDLNQLEDLAFRLFEDALANPTLPTIQAGLLLMQRSHVDSKFLNTQLVGAAFELGLHLDCSAWTIPAFERGLRKRLAWALYMEDQWCSLVHGRPSLISKAHWAVQALEEEDFEAPDRHGENQTVLEDLKLGRDCFCQMVSLTEILSSILDTLYTQKAMQDFDDAGDNGTRLVLARAKPIQVTLKEWFTRLPKDLKMDNAQAPATVGHLHLAYFATEITLHRCIVRSLSSTPTDVYLTHVCRSAAKARLISAMEFVNRLRPIHLTSFWYFPSRVNFALIATFGSLLLATAPCQEEADFYRARLSEYRWALSVSAKSAGFLSFAIESLESSTGLLKDMPKKPKLDDLDIRQVAPPPPAPIPLPLTRLIPPPEDEEYEDNDDTMEDISVDTSTDIQSLPIAIPQAGHHMGVGFMSPTSSAWSAPASYGPYIGPFKGLGAPNWFDQAHHGSPEAERMTLWAG